MPSCNGWEPSGQSARKSPACSAANSSKRWRKLPGKVWTSEVVAASVASVSMMFRCVWVCSFHPRNNLPNHHGVAPNWMWWASPVKNTTKVTITAFVCLWQIPETTDWWLVVSWPRVPSGAPAVTSCHPPQSHKPDPEGKCSTAELEEAWSFGAFVYIISKSLAEKGFLLPSQEKNRRKL